MAMIPYKDCSLGFFPDIMPEEVSAGAWSACTNMRFRGGFAERFRGMANVFGTPSATPYWITPYVSMTMRYWVTGCLAKLYAYDGTAQYDITPTPAPTGAVDDRYTGGFFNGVLIVNNSIDVPWAWGGNTGTPAAALTAWDSTWRAFSLRPFKNFLVAFGMKKGSAIYPHMVKWSGLAVPGAVPSSWNEADPASDAGEVDLAETADTIVDGLPMGDQMIVYKERSMYSMRFVGGQDIFAFQRIPGETGILARGCVVDTPIGHVVLTSGDVVVHQGGAATSICDGVIRKFIFSTMNSILANRSFVVSNPQKAEVLICFPSADSTVCDTAAVYNWISKSWGVRSLVNCNYAATGQINANSTILQWDSDSDAWETDATAWNENEYAANEARVLFARTTNISAFDVGTTDFGGTITSKLERSGDPMEPLGGAYKIKTIRGIRPIIDAPTGTVINITLGGAMEATDAVSWGDPIQFIVGDRDRGVKADGFASGRFLAYKFEGTGYEPWRLRSFGIDAVATGDY